MFAGLLSSRLADLLAAGLLALDASQDEVPRLSEPVEREWTVRRWALASEAYEDELETVLLAREWPRRALALDAARRAAATGSPLSERLLSAVSRALGDGHPEVRARALDVFRLAGEGAVADGDRRRCLDAAASASAEAPLPIERLAAARLLARRGGDRACDLLARLARDADPRVARAAASGLFSVPEPASAPERERVLAHRIAWTREEVEGAGPGSLDVALFLARARPDPAFFAGLRDALGSIPRAAAAELEAARFAATGQGDERRFFEGFHGGPSAGSRRQELFLLAALRGRLARPALLALQGVAERWAGGAGALAAWPGLAADVEALAGTGDGDPELTFLLDALAAAALSGASTSTETGAERVAALALDLGLEGAALSALVPLLGRELETGAPLAPWVDSEDPAVRRACVEALASILSRLSRLSRTSDAPSARLLAERLGDPDPEVSRRAFRGLCDAPDAAVAAAEELRDAWRSLAADERRERLAWLPRSRALPPFRDELVDLGSRAEEAGGGRRTAIELLAPSSRDPEVRAVLEAWLLDDLARLEEVADPSDRRRVELRVVGAVRALAEPAASVEGLERAFAAAVGQNPEIGVAAARALGRSAEGRSFLARRLADLPRGGAGPAADPETDDPDAGDRRIRVETALALLGADPDEPAAAAAARVLVEEYPAVDWDLRVRMLRAAGASRAPAAARLVRDVVADEGRPVEERRLAIEAAESLPEGDELLLEVTRGARDAEVRRAAVRALGRRGGELAKSTLARLFLQIEERPAASPVEEDRRRLLASELLAALGDAGRVPESVGRRWLEEPLRAAGEACEARLAGRELPDVAFQWRGRLELARALAAEGRLETSLEAAPNWQRLDGRLLIALADRATEGGEPAAAEALLRAGAVALFGEPRGRGGGRTGDPELASARIRLLGHAWAGGRWSAAERLAAELLADRRAGALPESSWRRAFGPSAAGVDPEARLEAAVWQARGWGALERGDVRSARSALDESRRVSGESRRARDEAARLAEALAARDGGEDPGKRF